VPLVGNVREPVQREGAAVDSRNRSEAIRVGLAHRDVGPIGQGRPGLGQHTGRDIRHDQRSGHLGHDASEESGPSGDLEDVLPGHPPREVVEHLPRVHRNGEVLVDALETLRPTVVVLSHPVIGRRHGPQFTLR